MDPVFPHPVLSDSYMQMVRLCGALVTDDQTIIENARAIGRWKVFSHGDGENAEYFALTGGVNQDNKKRHIHLDVARRSFLSDVKPNSSEEEVSRLWQVFFGQKVLLTATGIYKIQASEVHEASFIRAMKAFATRGLDGIEQTSAAYVFAGSGPLRKISWMLDLESQSFQIDVEASIEATIGPAYPKQVVDQLHPLFQQVILRKENEQPKSD